MTPSTLCLLPAQIIFPAVPTFNWPCFARWMGIPILLWTNLWMASLAYDYHEGRNIANLLNFELTEKTTGPMVRLVGNGYACQTTAIPEELEQAVGAWCEQGGTILLEAKRILAVRKK